MYIYIKTIIPIYNLDDENIYILSHIIIEHVYIRHDLFATSVSHSLTRFILKIGLR
jgi:hypothetical protein